tara:strand:+ start:173 stop:1078 length:906 start_codon:yes stop_codon:yes gene_type:complete
MNTGQINYGLIYLVVHGSRAYGLHTPESDWDVKGITIPPTEYFYSPFRSFEQLEDKNAIPHLDGMSKIPSKDVEGVVYSLNKFIKLAADCNPNMIDMLHVRDEDVLFIETLGEELRKHRDLFLSKKARFTFTGYAMAQLKRIRGHYERITNPPTEPSQEDFIVKKKTPGGTEYTLFNEQEYKATKKKYQQYLIWRRDRNPDRSKLEEQYGYDTKHAMHLVRLLRMGVEILRGDGVNVFRDDNEELLGIRRGSMSYDELIAYAAELEREIEALYETSPLPHQPDRAALEALGIKLTKQFLER